MGISLTLENLQKTSETAFKDSPVLFAYLYGSHATGAVHPFSDIDIAVYVSGEGPENNYDLEMSLALEIDRELRTRSKSDVRIINYLPLPVAGEVVTTGKLIYCRDDKLRTDFEAKTRMAYFDFIPFLKKYQQVYLDQIASTPNIS